MTGKAPFVPTLIAPFLLGVLHRLVAMATIRANILAKFIKGSPRVVIRQSMIDRQAMRRHDVSEDDLLGSLRMEQVDNVDDVELATIERGGQIGVIPKRRR